MRYENDGVVLLAAGLSLLLVALGLLNLWFWFALTTAVLMIGLVVIGYARRHAPIPALAALLLAYFALFIALSASDRPAEALVVVLGLPKSTSFLVYGIWPLGFLFGVVYFWFFPSVLPEEKLEKFLDRFRDQ